MSHELQINEVNERGIETLRGINDPVKRERALKAAQIAQEAISTAVDISRLSREFDWPFPPRKRIFQPRNRRPMRKQRMSLAKFRLFMSVVANANRIKSILSQPIQVNDYPAGGAPYFSVDMATGPDHTAEVMVTPDGKVVELPAGSHADLITYEGGRRGGKTVAVQAWKDSIVYPSGPPYVIKPMHEQQKEESND